MLEPCPVCAGTGEMNKGSSHYRTVCLACGGDGKLPVMSPPASQSEALVECNIPCKNCGFVPEKAG